ncbi:MAG: class I SAM-dependent methyltransferase [Rhodospirillales bacterium]|nr:class I SAM-dependent methyltransferase [Rhodospirillales bacterium]
MDNTDQMIRDCVARSTNRAELWINLLRSANARHVVEVGVLKGEFASTILRECAFISKYYMIDPWRHLDDWNKPANREDEYHEKCFLTAKQNTDFAGERRIILRGKTTEVVDTIPLNDLDVAYLDGDHTLRGITIDVIGLEPRVREGGWIGGDDFHSSIWQHSTAFEPTLVFPFSVYFAEAIGARIYGLPYNQFLMVKSAVKEFKFVDLTGRFSDVGLKGQFHPDRFLKQKMAEAFPWVRKAAKRMVAKGTRE